MAFAGQESKIFDDPLAFGELGVCTLLDIDNVQVRAPMLGDRDVDAFAIRAPLGHIGESSELDAHRGSDIIIQPLW